MTYKSSPQTFIFKYIIPAFMLIFGISGFYVLKNIGNELQNNFANAYGISLIWVSIFLIQMPFRLKKVVIDEMGLKMRSGNDEQIIPFKDILSVSKFDLSSPWMITVKYSDSSKNQTRKISYMPHSKYQRFMKEDEMTEYLTKQAKSKSSKFEETNTVKNLLIMFLAGLPFFVGVIYFISKSGFINF